MASSLPSSEDREVGPPEPKSDSGLENERHEPAKHAVRFYLVFVAIVFIIFLVSVDLVIVASSLPAIAASLHSTNTEAYWCGAGYILAQTVSQPILGGISQAFGRKAILQISVLIFLVASILCARARTIHWLIGTRVMQGIGGGGMTTLSYMTVTDMTTLQERPKWIALMSIGYALGNSGLVMGAAIVQNTTWRWIFYINIPVCTCVLVIIHFALQIPSPDTRSIQDKLKGLDWIGLTLLAGSTSSLLLGLLGGGVSHPWSAGAIIAPLVIGSIGLVAFGVFEGTWAKRRQPLLPPVLVSSSTAKIALFCAFLGGYAVTTLAYFIIIYFLGSTGYSVLHATVSALPTIILIPCGGILAGAIIKRTGDVRPSLLFGCVMTTAGMGSLVSLGPSSSVGLRTGLQVPVGLGVGFVYIGATLGTQSGVPPNLHPDAISLNTSFRTMGQAFGLGIGATILQDWFAREVNHHVRSGALKPEFVIESKDVETSFAKIATFPPRIAEIYKSIYAASTHIIWWVGMALAAIALVSCLLLWKPPVTEQGVSEELTEIEQN